jgi:hypothetical protein
MAFLISAEVSFSVGVSHLAYVAATMTLIGWGVDISNDYMSGGAKSFQLFGAYVGGGLSDPHRSHDGHDRGTAADSGAGPVDRDAAGRHAGAELPDRHPRQR